MPDPRELTFEQLISLLDAEPQPEGVQRAPRATPSRATGPSTPPAVSSYPEEPLPPPAEGGEQPGMFERILGGALNALTGIDDAADAMTERGMADPAYPYGAAYRYGWSPLWDYALRPAFDRAEEFGQFIGSPILQSAIEPGGSNVGILPGLDVGDITQDYVAQGKAYAGALEGPDGLDLRGATEQATDAGDYYPGVVGAAGVTFDPLNVPGITVPFRVAAGSRAFGDLGRRLGGAGAALGGAPDVDPAQMARYLQESSWFRDEAPTPPRAPETPQTFEQVIDELPVEDVGAAPQTAIEPVNPEQEIQQLLERRRQIEDEWEYVDFDSDLPEAHELREDSMLSEWYNIRSRLRSLDPSGRSVEDWIEAGYGRRDYEDNPPPYVLDMKPDGTYAMRDAGPGLGPGIEQVTVDDVPPQNFEQVIDQLDPMTPAIEPPLVRGSIDQRMATGSTTTARIPGKSPYLFDVNLVDLDDPDLLISHDAITQQPNPEYPQILQPRDRSTPEMRADVMEKRRRFDPDALLDEHYNLAEGVPIVGEEYGRLIVESGNGRMILIKGADQTYAQYFDRLQEVAGNYGITDEDLAQFNRPVLVRVRRTELGPEERLEFVQAANESQAVALSDTEQAAIDARRITIEMLEGFDNVDEGIEALLNRASNRDFVEDFIRQLPESERAQMTDGGKLSQYGQRRMKNAIFARTFGDSGAAVVRRFFQSTDPGVRQVQNAITRAIPKMFAVHNRIIRGEIPESLDISPVLAQALDTVSELQAAGGRGTLETRVSDHLAQMDAFARTSAEADILLEVMGKSTRSSRPLGDLLDEYTEQLLSLPAVNAPTMPGMEVPVPLRMELIARAAERSAGVDPQAAAQLAAWRAGAQPEQATGFQGNLGEGFETNTQQGFALEGGDRGQLAPRGDEELLAAEQARQEEIARGQMQMEVEGMAQENQAHNSELSRMADEAGDPMEEQAIRDAIVDNEQESEIGKRFSQNPDPPPVAGGSDAPPPPSKHAFEDWIDFTEPGISDTMAETLTRRHNGRINTLRDDIEKAYYDFQPIYRELGVSPNDFSLTETDAMLEVLHGRRTIESLTGELDRLRGYVDRVRWTTRMMEAGTVDFLSWVVRNNVDRRLGYDPLEQLQRMAGIPKPDPELPPLPEHIMADVLRFARRRQPARSPSGRTRQANNIIEMAPFPAIKRAAERYRANEIEWDELRQIIFDEFLGMVQPKIKSRSYFPRMWQSLVFDTLKPHPGQRTGTRRASMTFERTDMSFSEMREAGFIPKYRDPLLIVLQDRIEREREQMATILMHRLDEAGMVLNEADMGAGRKFDWRVPEVGRPFKGSFIPGGPRGYKTPSYAVPNDVADYLERLEGIRPSWNVKVGDSQIDIFKAIAHTTNTLKITKFMLSPFQPYDMMHRALSYHLTPRQMRAGWPLLKVPNLMWDTIKTYFSKTQARSEKLTRTATNTRAIFPGRRISHRMYIEEGLGGSDASVFLDLVKTDITTAVDQATRDVSDWSERLRWVNMARQWLQGGLFDTFYRNLMFHMMDNVEVPRQMAIHPDWADRQIVAEAARVVNIRMSSFESWQSFMVSNPKFLQILKLPFISINESRGWVGAAYETLPWVKELSRGRLRSNTSKESFLEAWAGTFALNVIIAEFLTYTATAAAAGDPLGGKHVWQIPGMLNPLSTDDEYANPWDYSSDFLRAEIPGVSGRGGRRLRADLMGQADTPFRITDPINFVSSRLSVPMRMVYNQIAGQTFFGEPLDSPTKRAIQAASDMMPIPVEGMIQMGRAASSAAAGAAPEGEGRLGWQGQLIQSFAGQNVSAETNAQLRDRFTEQLGLGSTYLDLEPYQRRIVQREIERQTNDELGRAAETSAGRGQVWGQYQSAIMGLNRQHQEELLGLEEAIGRREPRDIVKLYFDKEGAFADRKQQAAQDFGIEFEDQEEDPLESVLSAYHDLAAQSTDETGNFWYEDYERMRSQFWAGLTMAERNYILRNTNLTPVPKRLLSFLRTHASNEYRRIMESQRARQQHLVGSGLNELLDR